jgi:hypothetical protein
MVVGKVLWESALRDYGGVGAHAQHWCARMWVTVTVAHSLGHAMVVVLGFV